VTENTIVSMLPCRPGTVKQSPRQPASWSWNRPISEQEELLSGPNETKLTPG